MKMDNPFLILDIDGVLLEAHGYRLACIDTINDFLHRMGQPDLMIRRDIPDAFDASGISAEWDMVPLTLAAFVNWYLSLSGDIRISDQFPPICDQVKLDNMAFQQMLLEQIREYSSLLDPNQTVIDAIAEAYETGKCGGMAALREKPYWRKFFFNTLDPWKCPFFAQLMNRLLGSDTFHQFYGAEAPFVCESYLETKDRLIISRHYLDLLPELAGRKQIYPVIMTYRPTLYPVIDGNKTSSYFVNTPEGNCALNLLGWTDGRINMIGGGSLCYIEEKYGLRREYYVKPHPFHALASFFMALCRDEIRALEIARQLCECDPERENNPVADMLPTGERINLAVFEDSVSGIESTKGAVTVLRSWGYDVRYRLCGIQSTNEKTEQLIAAGAEIYSDVNEALDTFFC